MFSLATDQMDALAGHLSFLLLLRKSGEGKHIISQVSNKWPINIAYK